MSAFCRPATASPAAQQSLAAHEMSAHPAIKTLLMCGAIA
jgi:hypothetical protein